MQDRIQKFSRAGVLPVLTAVAQLFLSTSIDAAALYPTSLFDADDSKWYSQRNWSSNAFHEKFQELKQKGYMVVDLDVTQIDGQQKVSAVWQKNKDGRAWASWRNLSNQQFRQKWESYKNRGYRIIDQETYLRNGGRYYAGVWIKNKENLAWASFRNLTSAQFSEHYIKYRDRGYIPVDFEAYNSGSSVRYAVIWLKNAEGLKWKLYRNLSSSGFGQKFQLNKDEYRILDFESYNRNGSQKYGAIWVENQNGRKWKELRDMSADRFGKRWREARDQGYRLSDFEVYNTPNGTRYAGVWRQNGQRLSWPLRSDVNELLEDKMDEFDIPGMSVAIAKQGKFVYLRGLGHADIDDDKWVWSKTGFRLASISKAVGGVLALRLEEQGDIDLSLPSSAYIANLPSQHTHTVEQLISHRGGIGHYGNYGSPPSHMQYSSAWDAAHFFWNVDLLSSPGNQCKYSTHSHTLVGAAMEGAMGGQPIDEILADEFAEPFALSSLRVEDRSRFDPERATLYSYEDGENEEATPDNLSWKVLGGGLESSAYDLARLGMKLLKGDILSDASLDRLWSAPDALCRRDNFALGWDTGFDNGNKVVAKSGLQIGAKSYIRIYPDEDIVIVVLTNRDNGGHDPGAIGREIGTLMLDNL